MHDPAAVTIREFCALWREDPDAAMDAWNRVGAPIARSASRRHGLGWDLADDLVDEALCRALENDHAALSVARPTTLLRSWLWGVLRRVALERAARRQRRSEAERGAARTLPRAGRIRSADEGSSRDRPVDARVARALQSLGLGVALLDIARSVSLPEDSLIDRVAREVAHQRAGRSLRASRRRRLPRVGAGWLADLSRDGRVVWKLANRDVPDDVIAQVVGKTEDA
jgi:DNA-directed RNA polymerase specialized sigma24 family protein